MPGASGASHGVAAFVTLITGTLLSKFLWDIAPPLGEVSLLVMRLLETYIGADIPVTEQFAGTVVVMVGLSFVWGVVYHLGRHA